MRSGINRLFGRDRDKLTVGEAWNAYKRMRAIEERQPVLSRQAEAMWDRMVGGVLVPETWPKIPSIVLGHSSVYCPTCGPLFDIKPRWLWETLPGVHGNGYVWSCVLCCVRSMERTSPEECECCRLPRVMSYQLALGRPVPPRE